MSDSDSQPSSEARPDTGSQADSPSVSEPPSDPDFRSVTDPPSDRPSPWPARLVLVAGVLLGLAGIRATLTRRAGLLGVDLKVYYVAAKAALAGGDFYAASPAGHPYSYVYPPVTIPAFYPYALLDSWRSAFAVHTVVNVAAALGVAVLLIKFTERYRGASLPWLDRALLGSYVLLSLHSVPSILYGEVNFPLLLAIVAGFWWTESEAQSASSASGEGRPASWAQTRAGVAFALPAVVKVFPAFVGLWLLRTKAWRAIAAAVATGVGAFAVGVAAFGVETHLTYVRTALLPRLSSEQFAGGLAPSEQLVTLRRPLSVLFPSLPADAYGPLAFLLLAPVVAYCYLRIESPLERLAAVFATMTAMVVGFPSLLLYFSFLFFPMLPLLYLLERGPARTLFVTGALLANVALTFANVETLVTETPIPDAALSVLEPLLTVATPPLYGAVLMLAGCVTAVRRVRSTRSEEQHPREQPHREYRQDSG